MQPHDRNILYTCHTTYSNMLTDASNAEKSTVCQKIKLLTIFNNNRGARVLKCNCSETRNLHVGNLESIPQVHQLIRISNCQSIHY